MKTALELYQGVLRELDQYEAPAFDVADFNHYINKAINTWVNEELKIFEITQKVTDRLRPMIVIPDAISVNADNTTDVRQINLPDGYRHLVSCLITIRYKTASNSFAVGAKRSKHSERITGDNWTYTMSNNYLRPKVEDSEIRIYRRVVGEHILFLLDTPERPNTAVVIESVLPEYLKTPPLMLLADDYTSTTDSIFSLESNSEIVALCAKLFAQSINGGTLQLSTVQN